MNPDYYHRQSADTPLYADLIWSRPENRTHAGKLTVVGGNAHGFAAAAAAFNEATASGIGSCRVLLPDSLQKTVGRVFVAGEYAPSTPSGSFSKQALSELMSLAAWADGTLLAGDLGRNSETAILLESFVDKYQEQLTITKDALDYFTAAPARLIDRQNTLLVASFAQLQKLATAAHSATAFTFSMDFLRLVEALHAFTSDKPVGVITYHLDTLFVSASGQVSSMKVTPDLKSWRVKTAAHAATWWLQNSSQPFEAYVTAVFDLFSAKH